MTAENKEDDFKIIVIFLYGVNALSALLQFHPKTMLLGGMALMMAVVLSYVQRKSAAGTIYESHFHWMIRTFWIGGGVWMPILTVIGGFLMVIFTDTSAFISAYKSGDIMAILTGAQSYFATNEERLILLSTLTTAPLSFWWVWRCWRGYQFLKNAKSVENTKAWL